MSDQRFIRQMRHRLETLIEKVGWAVMAVGGTDDGEPPPLSTWSYTIGLTRTFGHAELIICGLPYETAQAILNNAGERIRGGERFEPGARVAELVMRYQVGFRTVHRSWYRSTMTWVYNIQRSWTFDALWLAYPDLHGRLPWEDGFDRLLASHQPGLDLPMPRAPTVAA